MRSRHGAEVVLVGRERFLQAKCPGEVGTDTSHPIALRQLLVEELVIPRSVMVDRQGEVTAALCLGQAPSPRDDVGTSEYVRGVDTRVWVSHIVP